MVDSDWRGDRSGVIGQQGALVRLAELPVEPDRCGQGEQPLGDAGEHPAQGAATMLFQPELVLEGVDDRLDPLAHPAQRPEPVGLVGAVGRTSRAPSPATWAWNSAPARPLSARMMVPWARACWRAASSSNTWATSRSPRVGVARHQLIGMPSGAHSRYSLKPQYQRLWLGA